MANAFGKHTPPAGKVPSAKAPVGGKNNGPAHFGSGQPPAAGRVPDKAGSARTGRNPEGSTSPVPGMKPSGAPAPSAGASKASGNSSSGLDTAVSNHADHMHKSPAQRGPKVTY